MHLETRPLHPLFGVEVLGVDLTRPLDDATFAAVRRAFEDHSLLLFRGQAMTDEAQLAFSERLGPLVRSTSNNVSGGTVFASQSNIDLKTGKLIPPDDRRKLHQLANRLWHSDGSYRATPALCSILSGREVTEEGGVTEFATLRGAWEALSEERKAELRGLVAEHSLAHSRSLLGMGEVMTEEQKKEVPPVRQALVRVNPVNGRETLYIGAHASHIIGWPLEKGRALLQELMELATRPRFVYGHKWRQGDLLMYDNRCLLHRATPFDEQRYRRFLQRTTIADAGPTAPQTDESGMRALG